jgi:hypothetical protein
MPFDQIVIIPSTAEYQAFHLQDLPAAPGHLDDYNIIPDPIKASIC